MVASVYGVVEAVGVGVRRRWCCSEASPRFSAHGIGPSSRFMGHWVGTANVGSRAPGVPLFYMALRERSPLAQ
jgi:hypothetical protein